MGNTHHSVCRICHVACDLVVELDAGRVASVRGHKNNPIYYGYSCIKGRETGTVLTLPSRLLHSMKRQPDGRHVAMDAEEMSKEVAERLGSIKSQYGSRAIALFIGTYASTSPATEAFANAFIKAIGSPMVFHNGTIDQPGKPIAAALHGSWLAGSPAMDSWDALLLIGTNPIVSMNGGLGLNPARVLKQARARGMKLVVVDPRVTDCAKRADVHIQSRPGEDAAILAGIIRQLLATGLIDRDFVNAETEGLEELRIAVEPFSPDYVASRAGISPQDIINAAQVLGSAHRGAVSVGTGGNMSGQGNIVEYLGRVLTSLRGWWLRAGDIRSNPGVLIEPPPAIAGTVGPTQFQNCGTVMRVRGLTESAAGVPTAALPDEILTPGDGQIKALIVIGGNPMLAWPDQIRTRNALKSLDLLVCIDPKMSATAAVAEYVFAPKFAFECETNSASNERWRIVGPGWGYEQPYAQVTPAVLPVPAGSDLLEDWEFFYDIARHMGLQLEIRPVSILDPQRAAEQATAVDMLAKPSTEDVWRMTLKGSPVSYDVVRETSEGRIFHRPEEIVQTRPPGMIGKLNLGAPTMMCEIQRSAPAAAAEPRDAAFPFRLISRRLHDIVNSCWHDNPAQQRRWTYNPAFMHPADLFELGIETGAIVEIQSRTSAILGVAEASDDIRRGCVSMSHCWGLDPDEPHDPRHDGGNTGRLVSSDHYFDRFTGIPLMSAIPVKVTAVSEAGGKRP